MRCRACERENREGARYCRGCGAAGARWQGLAFAAELERRAGGDAQARRREAERAQAVQALARSLPDAELRRGLLASAAASPL